MRRLRAQRGGASHAHHVSSGTGTLAAVVALVMAAPRGRGGGSGVRRGRSRRRPGYWLAGADGGVFAFGAPFFGSGVGGGQLTCSLSPQPPSTANAAQGCVAIASDPDGLGYWLLDSGRIATPFGAASQDGGCTTPMGARGPWTGMATAVDGQRVLVDRVQRRG